MLRIREHGVADYESLKDMDHTDVGELDDSDRACLQEIGDYLATTDAWQRFAVWLLHKHFEPADGEVFVERALPAMGKTETSPMRRSSFAGDGLFASGLRFDGGADGVALVGLEYSEPADFGDVVPVGDIDEEVLASVADRLQSHGKLDRFGIKVIRNPLGLTEEQILLETCDTSTRTQYCDIGSRGAMVADRTIIETTWRWRVTEGETSPVVMQECSAGCSPVGEGHDLAHHNTQYDGDSND
jgi:hypothetical protein